MAEDFTLASSSFNNHQPVNSVQEPLSPVLGSGQAVRKFRHKKVHKSHIEKKLKNSFEPNPDKQNSIEQESIENFDSVDDLLSITELDLSTSTDRNIIERIKKLEALKVQKSDIIKAISFNTVCDIPQPIIVDDKKPIVVENPLAFKRPITEHSFQTATGKNIKIPEVNIKLFDDILNNSTKAQSSNNRKYNYLHRNIFDGTNEPCEIKTEMQHSEKKPATFNTAKSVFENENFDDLHLGESIGFKKASASFSITSKNSVLHSETDLPKYNCSNLFENQHNGSKISILNSDTIPLKNMSNIFEEENDILNNFTKHLHRNIFDGNTRTNGPCEIKTSSTEMQQNQTSDKKPATFNRAKSIFENENFDDLELGGNIGFKKASASFSTTSKNVKSENQHLEETVGFKKVSTSLSNITKSSFLNSDTILLKNKCSNIFEGENFDDLNLGETVGFKKASASLGSAVKRPVLNSDTIPLKNKCSNIFEGENFDDLKLRESTGFIKGVLKTNQNLSFAPSGSERTSLKTCSFQSTPVKNIFEGESLDDIKYFAKFKEAPKARKPELKGFQNSFNSEYFSGLNLADLGVKPINTKSARQFISPMKNLLENTKNNDFKGFSNEEQQVSMNVSDDMSAIAKINNTLEEQNGLIKKIYSNKQKLPIEYELNNIANKKRKFSEIDSDNKTPIQNKKSSKKQLGCSYTPTINISEKGLKKARLLFEDLEPKKFETSTPSKNQARPFAFDLTPIPKNKSYTPCNLIKSVKSSFCNKTLITPDSEGFSLNRPSQGNVQDWLEKLNYEKCVLEDKIRVINERQTILNNQQTIMDYSRNGKTRILPGVLFKSKNTQNNKISLKNCLGNIDMEIDNTLNQINPQNAHLVHFNCCESHIKTQDGAIIVPNIDNKIGLPEIAHSFQVLDNVDPALIPKGWIKNHFKWIVWKLASYERMFGEKFQGFLTVENVVQQLKYRYDLEIDNAKRSILRKIFEKDECSQRRMILCVSNIIKKNNSYELELTDGWYSIRTTIDQPLSEQITKGKIKIGLKLIIYGSEIMNCNEGCHPLEANEFIFLKINFNCTRRALWWCKLGPQQESGPFLIPLRSINMNGGKIGRLKCFIFRVYPVKFMEKYGNRTVWRNRKAEERREQEFYKLKNKNVSCKSLQNIEDPEVLYNILHNSDENLEEFLSLSQKNIIYNYTLTNKSFLNKLSENRTVKAMLKVQLMDVESNPTKIHDFHIWNPGESHLEVLQEGEVVSLFNVACNPTWSLNSGRLTQFRRENKPKDERFLKFKRHITKIEQLPSFFKQNNFLNKFDSVGFVVKQQINENNQKVWLADNNQRLLLIKINDSPENILVLDTVNEGQIVAVCNLLIKHCFEKHSFAIGDHSVIFTRYPQYKHLQEGLKDMEEDFKLVDKEKFIEECQKKINEIEHSSKNFVQNFDDMDCSQITTTDIALLDCMDKLTN